VLFLVFGLIVSGCIPVVPSSEQGDISNLTKAISTWYVDGTLGTDDGSHGTGTGSSAFNTIQYAINDTRVIPGDTIIVAAGEFNLTATIAVNKSVTLLGAQSNVDPRGGRSGEETFLKGGNNIAVFDIKAHNVEINGFKIESTISNNGVNIIQDIDTNFTSQNATVRYNIITNQGSTMNEAVKIRVGTSPLIAYNYIHDIPSPGDAINFDRVNGGIISFNEVRNSGSENAAIYVYGSLNTTIEGNLVDTTSQNDGIKLGEKYGKDAAKSGGSILDNVVRNTVQDGITIYMSNVVVEGNDVSGSTSENGAIYLAYAISDITITNNCVLDNELNEGVKSHVGGIGIGSGVNVASVHINNNNIYNNTPYGVNNVNLSAVDATYNWWGDASGPSGKGTGTGDAVSTNVDFTSFLTSSAAGTPCSLPVDSVGPVTYDVMAAPNPAPIGETITLTATIDDTDTGGSNIASAEYSLNGGITWVSMSAFDSAFDSPVEEVTATIVSFTESQVVEIFVHGTDTADNTGEPGHVLLAVYDPTAGFVTGGGWINSPAGAYTADPVLTGKATFGFVSKYKKGATVPTGNTEFQFKAGDLNFHSDSYDWLVIAGDKAKYKGTGTINGAGEYGFMLTATDGDPDLFRIKIQDKTTDTVIYDNKMNSDDTEYDGTELGGGQIIVHKGK